MRCLWKFALFLLLIPWAIFHSCASENAYVVLNLEAGSALVAGVTRVDIEMQLGDQTSRTALEPGGEITFPTSLTVNMAGSAGTLVVKASAKDRAAKEVAHGSGTVEVMVGTTAALTIRLVPLTLLEITPTSKDLGLVAPGERAEATFTVRNAGQITTGGLTVALTGEDFVLTSNGCMAALPPGWTCTVKVELQPTTPGNKTAKLTASASPGGTVEAALSGTGNRCVWSKRVGGTGDQRTYAVATDGGGSVFLVGEFASTAEFGGETLTSAGSDDIFIAKYAADGRHVWSKRLGGTDSDHARAVAVDASGNVLLAGEFGGAADLGGGPLTSAGGQDLYLAKYSTHGTHLFSKRFGGTSDEYVRAMAVDRSGNVLLAGFFAGTADFGGGPLVSAGDDDIFVAKYDANGTHLWSKRFGAVSIEQASAVAVDASGNVFLAGSLFETVDLGGGPLAGAGGEDIFVAKYGASGAHLWSRRYGGADRDWANAMAVDGSGNVLVAGVFSATANLGGSALTSAGNLDIFVAKYNPGGAHLWSKGLGWANADTAESLAVDRSGNVVVAGSFWGIVDFGSGPVVGAGFTDIFVAKYDTGGTPAWSRSFGSGFRESAQAVAVDGSGNTLVTGDFSSGIDFCGKVLTSAGRADGFLVKLAP